MAAGTGVAQRRTGRVMSSFFPSLEKLLLLVSLSETALPGEQGMGCV